MQHDRSIPNLEEGVVALPAAARHVDAADLLDAERAVVVPSGPDALHHARRRPYRSLMARLIL